MVTCAPSQSEGKLGVTGARKEMNGCEWKNLTSGAKRGLLYLNLFTLHIEAAAVAAVCVCASIQHA